MPYDYREIMDHTSKIVAGIASNPNFNPSKKNIEEIFESVYEIIKRKGNQGLQELTSGK